MSILEIRVIMLIDKKYIDNNSIIKKEKFKTILPIITKHTIIIIHKI